MKKYDTILWDVDGTLLNFDMSQRYAITEAFHHCGMEIDEEIITAYAEINESYWKRLEKKEIEKLEVLRGRFVTLFEALSPGGSLAHKKMDGALLEKIDVDEFREIYQRHLGSVYYYQDDSLAVCKRLKQQGFRQCIITNGVTWTQKNKLTLAGFYDVMDAVFISEEIGFHKPDRKFFEGCFQEMERRGIPAERERMLVIGDSQTSDMQGARNLKIDCCLYLGPADRCAEIAGRTPEKERVTYLLYDLHKVEELLWQGERTRS